MMEKTKLIGTMGPAVQDKEIMREIILSGLNVARMNFSHGDHEEHFSRMKNVKELNEELGTNVALMLDTKGPEMRTHSFENGSLTVEKDQELTVVFEEVLGNKDKFSINYPGLFDDVEVGTKILIDDGYLQTTVIKKDPKTRSLVVKALNTHTIKNRRGVNVPNTRINMPFLSEKDIEDIRFGCKKDVDFIAASFVQRGSDIKQIKDLLKEENAEHIQVIAKIENQEGIDNLDDIIAEADGVMYARGDLGVEILPEDLPHIQKVVIEKCRQANKLVIVATQMLESMQNNPIPTRAEVSDVANAVFDGTDCVMLSGEMAAGKYPREAVKMMKRIVKANEEHVFYDDFLFPLSAKEENLENISFMSTISAGTHNVKAIVAENYELAHSISKYRPEAYVVGLVNESEARKLNAYFAAYPLVDHDSNSVNKKLEELGLEKGDNYLVVSESGIFTKKF